MAIAKVDTLHHKLKATASVDVNHKHIHRNEGAADAGSPKFRPYRSHTGAQAGRIIV